MKPSVAKISVALLAVIVSSEAQAQKRQVGSDKAGVLDTPQDTAAEATHLLGHHHAHSKYFQDFFTLQLAPHKLEFGHVCENPDDWEQRYEKKDFKTHRDQGKVRWGDKHGGYGEHYWDFNHAGHGHHDADDEGSEPVADYQSYDEIPSSTNNKEKKVFENHRYEPATSANREKRHHHKTPQLVLDQATGQVYDQVTGQKFLLQPLN